MLKLWFTAGLVMVSSQTRAADWWLIPTSVTSTYVDAQSREARGTTVLYSEKRIFPNTQRPYKTSVVRWQADCAARQLAMMAYVLLDASNQRVDQRTTDIRWQAVQPDSQGDSILQVVCRPVAEWNGLATHVGPDRTEEVARLAVAAPGR